MSKKTYPNEDINDLVADDINHEDAFFKGGEGSGVRGHKTDRPSGSATMNRKTGKLVPTEEYHEMVRKDLMNYSGFADVGGSFGSIKQVATAIEKITDHSNSTSMMIAQDLLKQGLLEKHGNVYMVMKPKKK